MAAPTTTVWDLEPHTRAKHAILRRYLQAWAPILSHGGFPRVLYVDGFAGPGRYSKGEEGSPIIALRAALEQRAKLDAIVFFLFIEKDSKRAQVLKEVVADLKLPENFHTKVAGEETFEKAISELLAFYTAKGKPLPPTFAFIDPFGWAGVPFSIVKSILGYPRCEVLVTFMYEEINRFIGHPDQVTNFDLFFGTQGWRDGVALADPAARNRFLHDLYMEQLRDVARAKYVRSFQMRNEKDVVDYYLFYATNSLKGLQKMKEAMWKIDESGEFKFSDATDPQQALLFAKEPDTDVLRKQILARFGGREATVGEIETFVLADTAFRETHYKLKVLRPMEMSQPPQLAVVAAPPSRKKGTYGDPDLRLRFLVNAK